VRGLKDEAEMEAIADALEKTRWCRKDAAKMLGISYKALLYKMRQFNLDTPRTRRSAPAAVAEENGNGGNTYSELVGLGPVRPKVEDRDACRYRSNFPIALDARIQYCRQELGANRA